MYCAGAVGDSSSGVCVPNPIQTTLCRFISYIKQDIIDKILIFAVVFSGLFFFVAAYSVKTFAQIMIGIAILKGAEVTLLNVLGLDQSTPICTEREALDKCLANAEDVAVDGIPSNVEYTNIRNLNASAKSFDNIPCGPLGCVEAECEKYTSKLSTNQDIKANYTPRSPSSGTLNFCEIDNRNSRALTERRTVKLFEDNLSKQNDFKFAVEPAVCHNDQFLNQGKAIPKFEIQCTAVKAAFPRKYFHCKNPCTESVFTVEAPASWQMSNCQDAVRKNIKYGS